MTQKKELILVKYNTFYLDAAFNLILFFFPQQYTAWPHIPREDEGH